MAEQVKADDSDVQIGSDSGSSDVVAQGGDGISSGNELGEVESVDIQPTELPAPPPPPEPEPIPFGVDQIGQEAVEPGREATGSDASRASTELLRGDAAFQTLLDQVKAQYAQGGNTNVGVDQGTGQSVGDQDSQFASAIANARSSLQSARGETIGNEQKRAGEFGTFLTDQRAAEDERQQKFSENETQRVGLLNDWNKQLGDMKTTAAQRSTDWDAFITGEQGASSQRQEAWNAALAESQARAQQRAAEWSTYMAAQQEAAARRQADYEAFKQQQGSHKGGGAQPPSNGKEPKRDKHGNIKYDKNGHIRY